MNILMFLIPVSMLFLGLALWAFIWAVKRGQFEDLDTSALDILREDEHDRPVRTPAPAAMAATEASAGDAETADPGARDPMPGDGPRDQGSD